VDCPFSDSLILAGGTLFAGGDGSAKGYDVSNGSEVWSSTFEGKARGLAAANGNLFLTTDKGAIHCFGGTAKTAPRQTAPQTVDAPYPADATAQRLAKTAERIVNDSGIRQGFALVTGGGNGQLAYEIAKRTDDLLIHVVEPDAERASAARRLLTRAGVHGGKVVVLNAGFDTIPYADYFANLIVCEDSLDGSAPGLSVAELMRMLKPCGGKAYFGNPSAAKPSGALTGWVKAVQSLLDADQDKATTVSLNGGAGAITRGKLPGAGTWTHQYGTPGNTASSSDTAVRAPIGILWYGEPGPGRMPSRHASNAAPLSVNGRFFVQGENVIMTHDAYNGTKLWEREIPGALRTGLKSRCSNLVAREDSLFVVAGGKCQRLDADTGETIQTYKVPLGEGKGTGNWGEYVACVGDLLFGSYGGNRVFALDVETGALRWEFDGSRVMHATICIDQGKVFFVDYTVGEEQKKTVMSKVTAKQRIDRYGKAIAPDVRRVVALDAGTGELLWEQPQYLSDCVRVGIAGGKVVMMASQGVVLLCGQPWNGHFWKEFFAGDFTRRSLIALSASDGHLMWSGRKGYRSRPLIVDGTVYAEPWSHDLHTGAAKRRINPLTGGDSKWQFSRPGHHCGNVVGSPNMLFFRSYSLAYYDLLGDYGTAHFGAQRTGCWINTLPANGLVMMPEASSSCQCAFPLQCTMVFNPRKKNRVWGMYSVEGSVTPVKHLGINFGAPGDRKSADGSLWLSWPRPQTTRLVLAMKAEVQLAGGGSYTRGNDDVMQIADTDVPWVYTSGGRGIARIALPLVGEAEGAAEYTVRLHFAETDSKAKAGTKPFDVKIQGKAVAKDVDVLTAAGALNKALTRDFSGIRIDGRLLIELVSKVKGATPEQLPTLCGLEVVRERVLQVGLTAPSFVTSNMEPVVKGKIRLGNFTEKPFSGKVSIILPEQFKIDPMTCAVDLKNGERQDIPVTLTLVTKGKPATLPLICKLLDADGNTENESQTMIEYLGKRGRQVVHPSADAHVNAGNPDKNSGYGASLLVDGGAGKFGDHSHNIAYLKFPIDVPGKAVAATFRIYVPAGGHTQSADSGVLKIADNAWGERTITFKNAPKPGAELAKIGKIGKEVWVERELAVDLTGLKELTIVMEPTSCDGATYVSREGPEKPELVIEYGIEE
jgi:outer membrane protein assembly factor BamB